MSESIFESLKRSGGDLLRGIPIIGAIAESAGIIGPPEEQQAFQDQIKAAQQNHAEYRPFQEAARMSSLNQQLALFGPINDMLEKMYGPGFRLDLSGLERSPLDAWRLGNPGAAVQGAPPPGPDTGYQRDPSANDLGVGPPTEEWRRKYAPYPGALDPQFNG